MKTLTRLVAVWFLSLISATAIASGPVVVIPFKGEVSDAQFFFLRRALKQAEAEQASAVILEMETFGGSVEAALQEMDALMKTKVPTITFINNKAISAGALVSLATQKIYMAPTAVIGAAAPVQSTGEDLTKTMKEKSESAISAMARAAAQRNGYRPELAECFIRSSAELKIGEKVIDSPDTLLTLSAEEAAHLYYGKPLLASGVASSVEEVIKLAGLSAPVVWLEPSGFEHIAFWITKLAPLLLLGGIIGAYVEMKIPGFGIPGIVSLICFALFFAGHYIAGLAGWEVAVCFAVGVALVVGEVFIHPGTIVPGLLGILLVLAALIYAMVDHWPGQSAWPPGDVLLRPLINLGLAFFFAAIAIAALARLLPETHLYRRLVLAAEVPSGTEPETSTTTGKASIHAGATGVAHTDLRPSGKALIGGRICDVVSEGAFVSVGQSIRVVATEGHRIVVEVTPT